MHVDPWVSGWLAGKYSQAVPFPALADADEWLAGFETGCAEVAEHHLWPDRLRGMILEGCFQQRLVFG